MIKKLCNYTLKGIFALALILVSHQAFAAAATFTGTATLTASSSTTVTMTVPGTALATFVVSGTTTADPTDLASKVVFNGVSATSGTTNGTTLATFVFPIAAGTGSNTLVISADVMNGTAHNILTTIASGSVTDNAPPRVLTVSPADTSASQDTRNAVIITFSEPMTTAGFTTTGTTFNTPVWSNSNATVTLSHNTFNSGTLYTVNITVATDAAAGLNSIAGLPYTWTFTTSFSGSSNTVVAAPVIPSNTSVSINSGATVTSSTGVTLALAATNATSMIISNNPFFTDSTWETYATAKSWTLSPGNGEKKVYVKFVGTSGVESDPISATITLTSASDQASNTPASTGTAGNSGNEPENHPAGSPEAPVITNVSLETPLMMIVMNLTIGSKSDLVHTLQEFLVAQNIGMSAKALAKNGLTKNFGKLTKAALAEWQRHVGITPASGNFGPKTRQYIKDHNL